MNNFQKRQNASKVYYKITILDWKKFNSKHKKSYKQFMIPNNFVFDYRVNSCSIAARWMFLFVLSRCSEDSNFVVYCTLKQLKNCLTNGVTVESRLKELQENQLITFEKDPPLIRNKGIKEIKEGRKECLTNVDALDHKSLSSVQRFEILNNQKYQSEIEKFKMIVEEKKWWDLKSVIPEMFIFFGTYENFEEFMKDFYEKNKTIHTINGVGESAYVQKTIKSVMGLIRDKRN